MVFLQKQNPGKFDVKWYLPSGNTARLGQGGHLCRVTGPLDRSASPSLTVYIEN